MTIFFISDLHLDEDRHNITDIFIKFLENQASKAEALYILGDFFEFWVGDDDPSALAHSIRNNLSIATRKGLPIYILHGNRDFLLKKKFFRETGCRLLPDEALIHLYGIPTLLMHGDTLCIEDIAYLKTRRYVRNRLVQTLFLLKSFKKRQAIVSHYRNASKTHTNTAADNIMDVTPLEVERIMLKHKVQHLIHGHTHRQAQHHFQLNNQPATRTVLGAWHNQGNALACYPDGTQVFIDLGTEPWI
jgi:UDP-2,3-diacylglucosamine hydrolase